MSWVIYVLAIVGFLSLVGTAGVILAAWMAGNRISQGEERNEE